MFFSIQVFLFLLLFFSSLRVIEGKELPLVPLKHTTIWSLSPSWNSSFQLEKANQNARHIIQHLKNDTGIGINLQRNGNQTLLGWNTSNEIKLPNAIDQINIVWIPSTPSSLSQSKILSFLPQVADSEIGLHISIKFVPNVLESDRLEAVHQSCILLENLFNNVLCGSNKTGNSNSFIDLYQSVQSLPFYYFYLPSRSRHQSPGITPPQPLNSFEDFLSLPFSHTLDHHRNKQLECETGLGVLRAFSLSISHKSSQHLMEMNVAIEETFIKNGTFQCSINILHKSSSSSSSLSSSSSSLGTLDIINGPINENFTSFHMIKMNYSNGEYEMTEINFDDHSHEQIPPNLTITYQPIGMHPTMTLHITPPDSLDHSNPSNFSSCQEDTSSVIVLIPIPHNLFADPYQLASTHWPENVFVSFFGQIELEKMVRYGKEDVGGNMVRLEIYNWKCKPRTELIIRLHARYHSPQFNQSNVNISMPVPFIYLSQPILEKNRMISSSSSLHVNTPLSTKSYLVSQLNIFKTHFIPNQKKSKYVNHPCLVQSISYSIPSLTYVSIPIGNTQDRDWIMVATGVWVTLMTSLTIFLILKGSSRSSIHNVPQINKRRTRNQKLE